ncbi:hypothetical protein NFI96_002754 [Prochilodus magdalenae]|nr:hypothetical protein NFI96_002754 [Prochilodus magdalenae]
MRGKEMPVSIFPVKECSSGTQFQLGCLSTGLQTDSWLDSNKNKPTSFIQCPALPSGEAYAKVSLITVTKADWDDGKRFTCKVGNGTLNIPADKSLSVNLVKVSDESIMCVIEDFFPKGLTIKLKEDVQEVANQIFQADAALQALLTQPVYLMKEAVFVIACKTVYWSDWYHSDLSHYKNLLLRLNIDHCDNAYFDYWGKGTQVTVTTETKNAPTSLFGAHTCAASSDGYFTLGCITSGFSPADALNVKWTDASIGALSDVVQYPAAEVQGGKYTAVIQARVKAADWNAGKKFSCQAGDSGGSSTLTLDLEKTALKISGPKAKELFLNNKAVIECVISGDTQEKVKDATVTWKVKGQDRTSAATLGEVKQIGSSFTKTSTLTIPEKEWFSGDEVECSTTKDQKPTSEKISVRKGGKQPSVTIYKLDKFVKDTVSLVCEVSSSDPANVYIMWKVNNDPYIEGNGTTTMDKNDKTQIVLSSLTMTGQQYNTATFTCAAKDPNIENYTQPKQDTTSKSEPSKEDPGVFIDCNRDNMEDEFNSLWSTASSFIFLFLFSLVYSTVVSLSKCAPSSDGFLTYGCVASGFFPANSITFSWTEKSSGAVRDVVQYPAVKMQNGKFTADLTIKWKKDGREVRGLDWKTTEKDSRSYRAVSVLEGDQASSSPGTTYTCEVTHGGNPYSADLSPKAEFCLKISPPQAKQLFLNSRAAIECVISGDDRKEVEGATVSWTVGGRTQTSGITNGGVTQTGSSFTKTSSLTITETSWFSGNEVMCSAANGLKTTSEKISVRKVATRPSITIYKPDKSVRDSDTVSLVCEASSSDLQDVYIMWKENGGQYKEGNGMTTMVKNDRTQIVLSTLTVTGQKYNSAEFTCAVKDANTQNDIQPRIFPPAKANSPPSIRLVEFGQSIMCIIEDFYPKALTIKWKKNDREVRGLDWKTTEKESGLYRTVSVLEENLASSSPGTTYTCEVTHGGKTYPEYLSAKAEFSLKISPPQAKELFLNSRAVIECVISGDNRKEVEGATVSWTVGGRTQTSGITNGGVKQTGSSFTKTSTLTITESVWFSAARPSVTIYKPDKSVSDSDTVSLVCEASSSDSADVYIMWKENGGQYMEGNGMTTMVKNERTQIVLSTLTVTGQKYNSAEFTCAVKDANIQNDIQPRIFPPAKANSPPSIRLVEFGQSIMCIIEDFYPKALTIKWKKNDREVRGLHWKTTEKESGLYRTVSVLEENLASSSPGTTYTCEVTHGGKTYPEYLSAKAEFSLKISPPQAKELFLNSRAAIECVISGDNRKEVEGATVSWTVGGRTQTSGITHGGVKQTGSSFTKTSTLTITESVWFSATRPSITIYKPDKSVRDSDTVSLVCEASSSDLQDVYIMWKENGGQYKEGNGMTTMVKNDRTQIVLSTLTVTGQKYNSAEFTCAVKDANTQNDIQPRIFPPAKANSAPTVRLVEFGKSIICIIEDFYPKALTIKWKKNDREVRGLHWKTTEKESGLFRTLSVLEGDQASSSPGTTYTCEVTHGGKPYSSHLSPKAEFCLKISPPQAKELFLNSRAAIECVISGDNRKEVEGATVSWTVGGRTQTSGITNGGVTQTGSSFTKTSTLTITESSWFSATRPSITIYKPDKSVSDSDTVSLVCEASSSDSADVYIMWKENGGQYMEGNGMTTMVKNDRTQIVLSTLTVTGQKYNSAEFTCAVKDANTQNDIQPRIFPPAKANSPPSIRLVEFGQSIMCIIEDFYPKALTIKWKKNDREVRGLDWKTTEKESGLYRTVSVLEENLASSSPGTTYTCEVTHGGKTYPEYLSAKAEFSLKISPPQAKELFLNSRAAIECIISGDNRKEVEVATVSWTVGGRTQTSGITNGGVKQTGSSFTKTSTLTIPESSWFSGKRSSITIYKPDKFVNDSDTVSLVCEVTSSDLRDVYIMWQENGGQYKEGDSTTTMTTSKSTPVLLSSLTVTGQQYNSKEIDCAVKEGNMENDIQPRTSTSPRASSAPTIRLVEFGQSVMCMIEDFYPKALTIKWKQNDREVRGLDWKTTEKESGLYRTLSVLEADLASSSPGTTYTCEVRHGGKTYPAHLSSKAEFSLKISPPEAKELFINSNAVIKCVINGDNRREVEIVTVSWSVGGQTQTSGITHGGVTKTGLSFTKTSSLTITESVWFSGKRPSITIYKPDKFVHDSDMVSLVCEVSSSDQANVYVMWQINGGSFMEGNSTTTINNNSSSQIVLNSLTVTGKQYNSAKFACAVKDANMKNIYTPITSTTSESKVNCPICPVLERR